MSGKRSIAFRPATGADRRFVEHVYFTTQRWLIEELFGWRGDAMEHTTFGEFYDEAATSIISADGRDVGWLTIVRRPDHTALEHLYLEPNSQRKGIGTAIVTELIEDARQSGGEIRLSTARINPARNLYARLGFRVVREDHFKVYMAWTATLPGASVQPDEFHIAHDHEE